MIESNYLLNPNAIDLFIYLFNQSKMFLQLEIYCVCIQKENSIFRKNSGDI